MWLNYLIHESEVDNSTEIEPHSPSSSRSVLKSSPSPNQSPTITSAKHRSYTLSQSSPTLSPTNGSLSPPSITSRMPNFVNKPSNIRIPSEDSYDGGESEVQINGVRQVAQSPILHPHNK